MIDVLESVFIVTGIVACSIAFLFVMDRVWPMEQRRQHNDLVGWQVTVVGTTYAVIIGFMLYAVWNNHQMAQLDADVEADTLVSISRISQGLPQQQRASLHAATEKYADLVVSKEWPEMSRGGPLTESQRIIDELWRIVLQPQSLNVSQQASLSYTIASLRTLTEHRRLRESQSRERLPQILWVVLIVGAVITIASACLFGSKSFLLHSLQILGLSTLLALSLLAVALIDRPFQGAVHVSPDAFIRAGQVLQGMTSPQ